MQGIEHPNFYQVEWQRLLDSGDAEVMLTGGPDARVKHTLVMEDGHWKLDR